MPTRLETFASVRPLLFSIAYRMLGSVMDAEDLVQDAYLRWQEAPDVDVRVPQAYLATIVTRLAINELKSARRDRETHWGLWLPEPLVTEQGADPSGRVELAESLSLAFLMLLERLGPVERAVFLLHDVFDFEYAEIARIVDKSEPNCRQLLARARQHVSSPRARFEADPAQAARLVDRFNQAAQAGDVDGVVALLAEDITLWAEGESTVGAPPERIRGVTTLDLARGIGPHEPIRGATQVAQFIARGFRSVAWLGSVTRFTEINGQKGIVVYVAGRPQGALVFDVRGNRIQTIYAITNRAKLKRLPALT